MRRLIPITLLVSAALAIVIVPLVWMLTREDREETARYERRETELLVSNLFDYSISLFKGGKDLQDTACISSFNSKSMWLPPGNYFLRISDAAGSFYVPIPLTGYRCGPDGDGSFVVTLRPTPKEHPPRLMPDLARFKHIPSGNFLLGDRLNPREPHYVWLTGYFMAPFEVSNAEFREFINDTAGYDNDAWWTDLGSRWKSSNRSHSTALLKPRDSDYARFGQPNQPVTWVTWFEANAFCKWLTKKIGGGRWLYALPTDAEWEKAARGPDNFDYALGMTISDDESNLYNWKKNPWTSVTVVGNRETPSLYRPNRYGLYHMTGNVGEWTQSVDQPYNREKPYTDGDRNHDDTAGLRTVRGGSWYSASIAYLYTPYRDAFQPEHSTQDIGFRIVARLLP